MHTEEVIPDSETTWFPGPKKYKALTNAEKETIVPDFLNPFILKSWALPLSYFNVGIAFYILSTPVSYYMISTLDVSSTQYSAYSTLIGLPWAVKFLFGMLSDGNPIFDYRRKSWLLIGWGVYIFCNMYLSTTDTPGFLLLTMLMFAETMGYLAGDVCADASCVERARFESDKVKGSLQTSAYTIRSFGMILGSLIGALLYNDSTWGWGLSINAMFFLTGIIPTLYLLPALWHLEELAPVTKPPNFLEQCLSIWETLQLNAVIYPITFIYLYSVLQIPNSAWTNFLIEGLDFSDFEVGMLTVIGCVLYWLGLVVYKTYFFETSWRMIYVYTTAVSFVFSLLQVALVLRWNVAIGIPDFAFALGDTAITTVVVGVQAMPACILFIMLCPGGSEGVTYALLTTISNLAGTVASDIGTGFTEIWDVSNDTLESGDFSGVLKLTILTSCLQLAPLVFLFLLPESKAEAKRLIEKGGSSFTGGVILLSVLVLSFLATVFLNIYWIFY